jgi:hypothetical protein
MHLAYLFDTGRNASSEQVVLNHKQHFKTELLSINIINCGFAEFTVNETN